MGNLMRTRSGYSEIPRMEDSRARLLFRKLEFSELNFYKSMKISPSRFNKCYEHQILIFLASLCIVHVSKADKLISIESATLPWIWMCPKQDAIIQQLSASHKNQNTRKYFKAETSNLFWTAARIWMKVNSILDISPFWKISKMGIASTSQS